MAYYAFNLVSRLFVYSPGRQQSERIQELVKSDYRVRLVRSVARGQLDVCGLGSVAWDIPDSEKNGIWESFLGRSAFSGPADIYFTCRGYRVGLLQIRKLSPKRLDTLRLSSGFAPLGVTGTRHGILEHQGLIILFAGIVGSAPVAQAMSKIQSRCASLIRPDFRVPPATSL